MKIPLIATFLSCLLVTNSFALQINEFAPTFSLRDSNGDNFFLSDYVGPKKKPAIRGVILSFFASYCEPCRRELPVLNNLVADFEKKGIKIVIVGLKEDFDKISAMLDEIKVDKPIILSDIFGKTGKKYGVTHLPVTFFIGVDGKVKDMIRGDLPNIEKELRTKAGTLL